MVFCKHLRRLYRNDSGVSAIEYAVLGAIVLAVIAAGFPAIKPIFDDFEATVSALEDDSSDEKKCNGQGGENSGGKGRDCSD